jgi:hypothetical protein
VRRNEVADRIVDKTVVNHLTYLKIDKSDLQQAIQQRLQFQETNEIVKSTFTRKLSCFILLMVADNIWGKEK